MPPVDPPRGHFGSKPPSLREVDFAKQKTVGVSHLKHDTIPVYKADSPLFEGALLFENLWETTTFDEFHKLINEISTDAIIVNEYGVCYNKTKRELTVTIGTIFDIYC